MQLRFEELKQAGGLCSPVSVGIAILQTTQSAASDLEALVRIAERDPASALRVIQVANRDRVVGSDPFLDLRLAALELGPRRLREELLRFSLASPNRPGYCSAFDYEEFWSWSVACAFAARHIAVHVAALDPGGAYLLGLTAHCGELAFATAHSERYAKLRMEHGIGLGRTLESEEWSTFQISRWEISAALIAEAGMPAAYRNTVLARALPELLEATNSDRVLMALLPCAEAVADLVAGTRSGEPEDPRSRVLKHGANLALSEARLEGVIEATRRSWSEADAQSSEALADRELIPAELCDLLLETSSNRPRALVAEPDETSRGWIGQALADAGYEVHEAADGLAALRLLERFHPEIVITAWSMPGIGGGRLCEELRQREGGVRSYVIMLTRENREDEQTDAFRHGVDDCVAFPVSTRLLLARVQAGRRMVELQKQVENDKKDRLRQISELSALTRRLEATSTVDDLTGLPNRRYALSRLEQEWKVAERLGTPLSVIMVDVDHFKAVNDALGHGQGDVVLQEIGLTMQSKIRRADVVCRMGGEEFLVINVDSTFEGAWQCAERLRSSVERRGMVGAGPGSTITISLGVATREAGMSSCTELLRAADQALYAAKSAGRNRVSGTAPQVRPTTES